MPHWSHVHISLLSASTDWRDCIGSEEMQVAAMKHQTIKRLGLQAAMYGTRLKQLIVDGHGIKIR